MPKLAHVKPKRCTLSPGNADPVTNNNLINRSVTSGRKNNPTTTLQNSSDAKTESSVFNTPKTVEKVEKTNNLKSSVKVNPKTIEQLKIEQKENPKAVENKKATAKDKPKAVENKKATVKDKPKTVENKKVTAKDKPTVVESKAKSTTLNYEIAFKAAKELLKGIERNVNSVYKRYFENQSGFKHTSADLLKDMHEYLQALFMAEATANGANEGQLQFIYSLLRKADLFEGVNGFKQLFEKSKRVLSKVPVAYYCFVAVDKGKKQNLSSYFINSVYGIYTLLSKLQIKSNVKKKKELLANLIAFAKERGVLIND